MFFLFAAALAVAQAEAPKDPPAAIAAAEAHPERGTTGLYRMRVAAAERHPDALYLNSSPDYRSPDDVTFHLTSSAAHTLEKRLGARPETALVGRTVTVRGAIRRVAIANTVAGRAHDFNRYQHTVLVTEAAAVTVE